MKTRLALILIVFLTANMITHAQNNVYPTSGDVTIYNYSPSLLLKRNTNTGGFTQGIQTQLQDGTNCWFFGTLHGNEFRISKGDYQDAKLVVNSSGYVGIGTTSPSKKLTVIGGTEVVSYFEAANSGYAALTFSGNGGATKAALTTYNGNIYFGRLNSSQTGSCVDLIINSNGYVGIGTATPISALDINGTITLRQQGNGTTASPYETEALRSFVGDGYAYPSINFVNDWQNTHRSWMNFNVRDGNHNKITALTINGDGNVGIGTTNPGSYKLAVEGTIGAREVKVTTAAWADFVFHPTYKLRTLREVEQFIKANNHLPEIPTETEVKENGIGLGEMNAKLLQKIEELTLYMIEQNKKIIDLEKKVIELNNNQ